MPLVFREDTEKIIPPVVSEVLRREGWIQYDEDSPADQQAPFNLFWKTNRFFPSQVQACRYPYQRVNHYPKSSEITKKDAMCRHLKRMRGSYGAAYDFVPTTFVLPNEYVRFCQFFADQREKAAAAGGRLPIYICKPSDMSRGRKIFVFDDIGDLTYDCSSVVQQYVSNPLLVKGHKFDMRIYVLVTSFQPLRAYIYDDFLARFSVELYNLDEVRNVFAHLTNYSISKTSTCADDAVRSGIGALCKWDAKRTREYFASAGIDFDLVWRRIECLTCLTLLSICNNVPTVPQCFELYGFDVLLDDTFRPWLMEVNFSPALAVESDVDERVKGPLIRDLIHTLHICAFPDDDEDDDEDAETATTTTSTTATPHNVVRAADNDPNEGKRMTASSSTRTKRCGAAATKPVIPRSSASAGRAPLPRHDNLPVARGRSGAAGAATTQTAAAVAAPAAQARVGSTPGRRGSSRSNMAATAGRCARVPLRRSTSSGSTGGGSNGRGAPTTGTAGAAAAAVKFVDRPEGGFKWLFPFGDACEAMSVEMGRSHSEQLLRHLVGEVKRRDAKAAAAMKDFAAIYSNFCAATRASGGRGTALM